MRKLDDWLTSYLEYTSEQESPSLFHLWVGLSTIAAALERRTRMERGYYVLRPNLYVVLVGASARVRKTTAITIGRKVLQEAIPDLIVVGQRTTPEALMSIFIQGFKDKKVSGGWIVSDELGVFLGGAGKNMDLIQLLTKWYDCPDFFDYHTLIRGKEVMNNVYCNMLAGSTPDWLKTSLPPGAVGGGFTSRIVFVYQDKPEKLDPFPTITKEMMLIKKDLVKDLARIGKLHGEFTLTEAAKDWFSNWYLNIFKPETSTQSSLDGYFGRKHDTLLKLGMCFSASKSDDLVVDAIELEMGLKALAQTEKHLPQTIRLIQMTESGKELDRVYRVIKRKGEISHVNLMRQVSYAINAKILVELVEDLIRSEKVKATIKEGKTFYSIC